MSNLTPDTARVASYLITRERLDIKGKLKCNPPNRPCGDRCIPPSWKCRVKGEGTDSHSRVVAGDPLAGAASIARGRARLVKGLKTGNISDIQGGRAAIARGIVKSVPGQNIKQKQNLRKQVEGAIVPVATGLFAVWALRQGHEGAKVLFPQYAKGPARDIENAAGTAVGFVLDRVPIYGSYRQAVRKNASLQAQVLARASIRRALNDPDLPGTNVNAFGEITQRKVGGVRAALSEGLDIKQGTEYGKFRTDLVNKVLAAKDPSGRSIYAEPAAVSYLAKNYGISFEETLATDGLPSSGLLIRRLSTKLNDARSSMRADMQVRGLDWNKTDDVERYVDIAARNAAARLGGNANAAALKTATDDFKGTIRQLLTTKPGMSGVGSASSVATNLYRQTFDAYDGHFKRYATNVAENSDPKNQVVASLTPAATKESRAALIGVAELVKGRVGITAPIAGGNHAELVMQKVFNEYALTGKNFRKERKSTWAPSDADIRYAAQDLGWEGQGVDSAIQYLQGRGFPNLASRPARAAAQASTTRERPTTGTSRPARRRSPAAAISDLMRQKNSDGTPRFATREAAQAEYERRRARRSQ